MTFGTYVNTLVKTGFFGNNKAMLGHGLFMAAGSSYDPSVDTVKKWLRGARSCNVRRYFPDESINVAQFISYFRRRTNATNQWKKLQMAFVGMEQADVESGGFCVDLGTDDPEMFYWSLLNQFQRIFHLPESEREVNGPTASIPTVSHNKPSVDQVRNIFLESIRHYNVMDIINRKPAILNWDDSANLNVFLSRMDTVVTNCNPIDHPLYASIDSFTKALHLKALSLEANLSSRFEFGDATASFNMEDDEDWEEDEDDEGDEVWEEDEDNEDDDEDWDEDEDEDDDLNRCGISELSPDLIVNAYDPAHLLEILVEE